MITSIKGIAYKFLRGNKVILFSSIIAIFISTTLIIGMFNFADKSSKNFKEDIISKYGVQDILVGYETYSDKSISKELENIIRKIEGVNDVERILIANFNDGMVIGSINGYMTKMRYKYSKDLKGNEVAITTKIKEEQGLEIGINNVIKIWQLQLLLTVVTIVLAIMLVFPIRKIYRILKEYGTPNISWKLISIILTIIVGGLSAYLATIPRLALNTEAGEEIIYYNGSTFIIYFIILIGVLYFLGNKLKDEIKYKQELREAENLKDYTRSLEGMYGDLRKFRHDYINIISSIVGYIDDEDIEGLKDHVYTNLLPLEKNINRNNTKIYLLKNIKLPELKGLVSSKLIRAQELNINVTVDIMEDIESINVNVVTICRLIGILLDNAIEECESIENSYVTFGIIKNEESIDFIVSNSCRVNIEPIYMLNTKGFSTKGSNRGLGLSILEELIF